KDTHHGSEQAQKATTGSFFLREVAVQDPFDRRAIQLPSEGLADTSEDHGQGDREGVPLPD
ncbi:MAG TPA: hypothetical protein PKZ87_03340, partial [Sphaerochaeta sp.]|nr:hypothetical protein [Sphaerochaeta sp.]